MSPNFNRPQVNSEGLPEKYSCSVNDDELDISCNDYVLSLMEDGNATFGKD